MFCIGQSITYIGLMLEAYTKDAIQKCNTDRACKTFGSKSPKVNSTKRIYLKFGPCQWLR